MMIDRPSAPAADGASSDESNGSTSLPSTGSWARKSRLNVMASAFWSARTGESRRLPTTVTSSSRPTRIVTVNGLSASRPTVTGRSTS